MKFPLMAVWMQLAHKAAKSGIRCWLKWRPRLENQQADRLTNEVFTDFKGENRVSLAWADLDLGLVKELVAGSEGLQEQIKGNREWNPKRLGLWIKASVLKRGRLKPAESAGPTA